MTKNAQLILEFISGSTQHPNAEDIYEGLKRQGHKMAIATVYNNLNWLVDHDQIKRMAMNGESDRYDRMEQHDHLVCTDCGKITDIKFEDLTEFLAGQFPGNISGYDLKVNYVCEDCMKKRSEEGVN